MACASEGDDPCPSFRDDVSDGPRLALVNALLTGCRGTFTRAEFGALSDEPECHQLRVRHPRRRSGRCLWFCRATSPTPRTDLQDEAWSRGRLVSVSRGAASGPDGSADVAVATVVRS
jgi:hypothetical protein